MAKSGKSCKCDPHEICEECPEWIFTLADLIMCMMGLFVLLWVLKPSANAQPAPIEDEQLVRVLAAIRDAFEFLPDSTNPDKVDVYRLMKKLEELKPFKGPGLGGETKVERRGAEGTSPEVVSVRKGAQSIVGSRVMFPPGGAALDAEGHRILDEIAALIKGHRNVMLVKGHASNDDSAEAADPKKLLDLSLRRAQAVADHLVSRGVEPDILRVLGCSTFEPVAQRAYTPEARQLNRRVEVESTSTLVADFQDKAARSPEPRPAASAPTAVSGVDFGND